MEYLRKPNRIQKEKRTTLDAGVLTGENGKTVEVASVEKVHHYSRHDGMSKLVVSGNGNKVTILSHTIVNGRIVQKTDVVEGFLEQIIDEAKHKYTLVKGSNTWFYAGITCIVLGALATVAVIGTLTTGGDLPRKALTAPVILFLGIVIAKRGRAVKLTMNA